MGTLKLKRGTKTQLQTTPGYTPAEGELVYTTDSKEVFVGDGTTVGGVPVSVSTQNLEDLGNVQALAAQKDQILVYNGSNWAATNNPALDLRGNIYADDSTLLVDAINGKIVGPIETSNINASGVIVGDLVGDVTGSVVGNVVGNTTGTHFGDVVGGSLSGTFTGDISGSVFGDDSTPIVDAINKTLTGDLITPTFGRVEITNPGSVGNGLNGGPGEVNLDIYSNDNRSLLNLRRRTTDDLTGDTDAIYGTVTFGRDDVNGVKTTAIMFGRETSLYFGTSAAGVFNAASQFMVWKDYKLGVGLTTPTEAVDVNGNGKFSGSVTSGGFVQFGSYTDAEIGAITPANGMVYYNSTDNRFRGYQNGGWINLDDGSPA